MNNISIFGPLDQTHQDFGRFVSAVEQLFENTMAPDLLDDRLNRQWRTEIVGHGSYRAALSTNEAGDPIGLLEHWATSTGDIKMEFLLDQQFTELHAEGIALVDSLLLALREPGTQPDALLENKPRPIELWARPASPPVELAMTKLRAQLTRHLFQMRTVPEPIAANFVDQSVGFTMADLDELIEINNLAFADHPDQANMTIERFDRLMAEPWFVLDGIRLWLVEGRIAAFCWTKIHTKPSIGEIYVVGVNPDDQGHGLGKLVTAAGVHWLQKQQQQRVMLYVEANNTAAVAVYKRLGFDTVRTDKAWQLPLSESLK